MRSTRRGPAVSGVSSFTYGAAELEPRAARALLREVTLVVLAAVGVEQGGCLIALGIRGPRGRPVWPFDDFDLCGSVSVHVLRAAES